MSEITKSFGNNGSREFNSDKTLGTKIKEIKEKRLNEISPIILIKPAIFSFIVLIGTLFIDLSSVPLLGNVTIGLAQQLYPNWEPATASVEPVQFWWLPLISYLFFMLIAFKEYRGLFAYVRSTTPKENIDRIISSSISLIDGYATALPLVGAAFLLVSIKLGPEIFLGLSVPFEIKALIVLAIAKLFEPVLDYIGVKFQKIINEASDFQERYYQKLQLNQTEKLIQAVNQRGTESANSSQYNVEELKLFKEELEKIQTISFETYQNFTALNKLSIQLKNNLEGNQEHLNVLNNLSQNIDSMASNLGQEAVTKSLSSLELIVNKR